MMNRMLKNSIYLKLKSSVTIKMPLLSVLINVIQGFKDSRFYSSHTQLYRI